MVICNTKEVAVIKCKYVDTYCHPWFAWNFMGYNFFVIFARLHTWWVFSWLLWWFQSRLASTGSLVSALLFFYAHVVAVELFKCLGLYSAGIVISSAFHIHTVSYHQLILECSICLNALFYICYVWWSTSYSCMSCIVMHVGISVVASLVFMLSCRPTISLSLHSAWFCQSASQQQVYRSCPGL